MCVCVCVCVFVRACVRACVCVWGGGGDGGVTASVRRCLRARAYVSDGTRGHGCVLTIH